MKAINPPALGKPVGYNHGMLAGNTLYVSGQVGARPGPTGALVMVGHDFAPQFDQALDNVLEVVREAGGQPQHLVELTIFVTSIPAYHRARQAIGEAWKKRLGKRYPAVTLVQVAALYEPGAVVEIRAVAHLE